MKIPQAHNDWGPDEGEQDTSKKKKTLRKMGNPVVGFVWRFLACCLVIDISIWAYFNFVKKVPLFTGLQQLQDQIRVNRYKNQAKEYRHKIIASSQIEPTQKLPILSIPLPEDKREEQEAITETLKEDRSLEDKIKQHKQDVYQMVAEDNIRTRPKNYDVVVYSYVNKEGRKIYSNIGFPKDEPYTEPKILR